MSYINLGKKRENEYGASPDKSRSTLFVEEAGQTVNFMKKNRQHLLTVSLWGLKPYE